VAIGKYWINVNAIIKQTGWIEEIERGFTPLSFYSTGDDANKKAAPTSRGIHTD
jgi:hypothetical protein